MLPQETRGSNAPTSELLAKQTLALHAAEKFVYEALPTGDHSIRVLDLHPGTPDDPIACDLRCIDLTSISTTYEALSYTWDSGQSIPVKCSNAAIFVKSNLFNALWVLRRRKKVRILWADAICINQDDLHERAQQVKIMHLVYRKAASVRVWLGVTPLQQDVTRTTIAQRTFRLIKQVNALLKPEFDGMSRGSLDTRIRDKLRKICSTDRTPNPKLRLVSSLFERRPWFKRVWVQQEVGLADTAIVSWGLSAIPWSDMVAFVLFISVASKFEPSIREFGLQTLIPLACLKHIWSLYNPNTSWLREQPALLSLTKDLDPLADVYFLKLLNVSRDLLATDKHDHIYALLTHPICRRFLGPVEIESINIDYSAPVEHLFLQLAKAILRRTRSLVLLSFVEQHDRGKYTWVPRWDQNHTVPIIRFFIDGTTNFDASKWQKQYFQRQIPEYEPNIKDDSLHVQSIVLGDVDKVYQIPDFAEYSDVQSPLPSSFRDLWNSVRHATSLCPLEIQWRNFIMSLTCGTVGTHRGSRRIWRVLQVRAYAFAKTRCAFDDGELKELFNPLAIPDTFDIERACHAFIDDTKNNTGRKLFRAHQGFVGLVPWTAHPNDLCCVLVGAPVPFLVRRTGTLQYRLLGECYVNGVMEGEVVAKFERGEFSMQSMEIV